MRFSLARNAGVAMFGLAIVVASSATAQNFAGASWVPLTRGGLALADGVDNITGNKDYLDIVGDETSPAAYIWSDGPGSPGNTGYLYFRMRINKDPSGSGTFNNGGFWACAIDSDANPNTYEFLAVVDGGGETVGWRYNALNAGGPAALATVGVTSPPSTSTNARIVVLGSNFSSDADYFIDFAVPWTTIVAGGNGVPAFPVGAPVRFACGTSTTTSIGTDQASTAAGIYSDRYVCSAAGCFLDTDGDGVWDTLEAARSTLSNDTDSDNDNIPDNYELSSGAGPYGPYSTPAPDTDSDGTIDALDTDSDNDCKSDLLEGLANYRTPSGTPSANCSGATPVCDTSNGSCVACDGDNGAVGGSAPCPSASTPACHSGDGLDGRCTVCRPGKTEACDLTPTTPACSTATGACVQCNGDHGESVTAACPSDTTPACHTAAGPLQGRCTTCSLTNVEQCSNPTPACDDATGACDTCNGDFEGGTDRGCPSDVAPYCFLTGGSTGTCGTCSGNADCGDGHSGPTCQNGTCVDIDSDGDGLNDSVEKILGTNFMATDSDGDGLGDLAEVTPQGGGPPQKVDTDKDGTIDALDTDSDGDSLPDQGEGSLDTDTDGVPNYRDADDDSDGISTKQEIDDTTQAGISNDVDGDGKVNWLDIDSDGDGTGDSFEGRGDEDSDGIPDYLDATMTAPPLPDAGPPPPPPPPPPVDAGPPVVAVVDDGRLEGTGLFCSASVPSTRSNAFATLALLGIAVAAARRRRDT